MVSVSKMLKAHQDSELLLRLSPVPSGHWTSGGASILKLGIPAYEKNPIHSSIGLNPMRIAGKERRRRIVSCGLNFYSKNSELTPIYIIHMSIYTHI